MRLNRSILHVIACLSAFVFVLPTVCSAGTTVEPTAQQLQQQIIDNLVNGKDVKALIAQVKALSGSAASISNKPTNAESLQQQLTDFQKTLHPNCRCTGNA